MIEQDYDVAMSDLQKMFEAFRREAEWLRNCYNIYIHLYEADGETDDVLKRTAGWFFWDLNRILIEYIFLQVGKLTDPAQTSVKGGKRDNLTINHIDARLEAQGLLTKQIRCLSKKLLGYGEKVVVARNKLIAHLDRDAVLTGTGLGAHTEEEMVQFYDNLQKYCDAVGNVVGAGPSDFSTQPGSGDVVDLLSALKRSNKASGGS